MSSKYLDKFDPADYNRWEVCGASYNMFNDITDRSLDNLVNPDVEIISSSETRDRTEILKREECSDYYAILCRKTRYNGTKCHRYYSAYLLWKNELDVNTTPSANHNFIVFGLKLSVNSAYMVGKGTSLSLILIDKLNTKRKLHSTSTVVNSNKRRKCSNVEITTDNNTVKVIVN